MKNPHSQSTMILIFLSFALLRSTERFGCKHSAQWQCILVHNTARNG